jgi:hypothetical protein
MTYFRKYWPLILYNFMHYSCSTLYVFKVTVYVVIAEYVYLLKHTLLVHGRRGAVLYFCCTRYGRPGRPRVSFSSSTRSILFWFLSMSPRRRPLVEASAECGSRRNQFFSVVL